MKTSYTTAASIFTIGKLGSTDTETNEAYLKALADAIALARKGEATDIVHKSDKDYANKVMEKKLNLFKEGALMSITLTKSPKGSQHQLRGWIVGPNLLFWEDGSHVDEYDNRAIFEVSGDFAQLKELAEKHLTQKMRRFEDDKYVIWI